MSNFDDLLNNAPAEDQTGKTLTKEEYAANFDKVYLEQETGNTLTEESAKEEYYYKLPYADYYLIYEEQDSTGDKYLFHLYEFVLDDSELGLGHTVTYGWYKVDKKTGSIEDVTQ
jgi:hypothetical protein